MMDLPPRFSPFDAARLSRDLYELSKPDAVSAYTVLWMEYFHRGELPKDDDMVRRISCTSVKKWPTVRRELMRVGFTEDWRHPRWDEEIAKAVAKTERKSSRKKLAA